MKALKVAVLATLLGVLAAPCVVLVVPQAMLTTLRDVLATQDAYGNSRGA